MTPALALQYKSAALTECTIHIICCGPPCFMYVCVFVSVSSMSLAVSIFCMGFDLLFMDYVSNYILHCHMVTMLAVSLNYVPSFTI